MTVRGGRLWPFVGAAVGLGVVILAVGWFLARAGLEDADRWASVIGLFLNIAGVAMAVVGVVHGRRSSHTAAGTVAGPAVPGQDVERSAPPQGDARAGNVENRIEGGSFHGPVLMGRDMYGVGLASPGGNTARGDTARGDTAGRDTAGRDTAGTEA